MEMINEVNMGKSFNIAEPLRVLGKDFSPALASFGKDGLDGRFGRIAMPALYYAYGFIGNDFWHVGAFLALTLVFGSSSMTV
jgi:hypothetical protein